MLPTVFYWTLQTSAASKESGSRRTLSERNDKLCFCVWVWYWKAFHSPWEPLAHSQGLQWGGFDHPSVVEGRGDFRLFFAFFPVFFLFFFSRHETRIPTMSRSSWDSLPFLPQSTKLQKSHWNYQTWPALNIQLGVIWCFSKGFFFPPLILIFRTTASLTSRCLFKTPCVRLHWQMLECFCSEWFPQGIVDCPHSSRESLLEVRETKRGHLDEANRQSWRSINGKKVEEKEGGWGREGNMLKSKV